MEYLLDTCTVSDLIKGDKQTIDRLRAKSPLQIKISAITAYELYYGLKKNPQLKKKTQEAILGFIEDIEIIPFGLNEAEHAAFIRAKLAKAGSPIGAYDVLIGATAISQNYILVTSNEKEFERISDLKIENWRTSK